MQRGFTVIELVIIIAIISILAGLALPAINETIARQEILNAARLLESDIRWVQQMAMNTTPDTSFPEFKPQPNKYSVKSGLKLIKSVNLPAGVTLSGPKTLTFGMNGTPITDGQALPTTFFLTSKKTSLTRHVVVSSVGRVRIE